MASTNETVSLPWQRVNDNYLFLKYGFESRGIYQHASKHCNIVALTFNTKTNDYIILDSRGVTRWCKNSAVNCSKRLLDFGAYEFNVLRDIIYCRAYNVYFALTKGYGVKVYNLNFHESFFLQSDGTTVSRIIFDTKRSELITISRDKFQFWKFTIVEKSRACESLMLQRQYHVLDSSMITNAEFDQDTQRLYLLCDHDVWCYDVLGSCIFHVVHSKFTLSTLSVCAFSKQANALVTGTSKGEIPIFSTTGGLFATLLSHSRVVTAIVIHPGDGNLFISASLDGTIKVFSLQMYEEIYSLNVFHDGIMWMKLRSNSTLYCGNRRNVHLYDLNHICSFWSTVRCPVESINVFPKQDGKSSHVLVHGIDQSIRIYSKNTSRKKCTILPPPELSLTNEVLSFSYDRIGNVIYILFSHTELWIYITRTDPATRVAVWNIEDILKSNLSNLSNLSKSFSRVEENVEKKFGMCVFSQKQEKENLKCLCTGVIARSLFADHLTSNNSQNFSLLMCGMSNGTVYFLDPCAPVSIILDFKAHPTCPVLELRTFLAGNETRIITLIQTVSWSCVKVWDTKELRELNIVILPDQISVFSMKSSVFVSGNYAGYMQIKKLDQRELCYDLRDTTSPSKRDSSSRNHNGRIISVDILERKEFICSCGEDHYIRLWNFQKHLLTEIQLDKTMCYSSFLNNEGSILLGFKSQLFTITHAVMNLPCNDSYEVSSEDSGNESDIYEDPHIRKEMVKPTNFKTSTLENYLIPYPYLGLESLWMYQKPICDDFDKSDSVDNESISNFSSSGSEAYAPTEIYSGSLSYRSSVSSNVDFPQCCESPEPQISSEHTDLSIFSSSRISKDLFEEDSLKSVIKLRLADINRKTDAAVANNNSKLLLEVKSDKINVAADDDGRKKSVGSRVKNAGVLGVERSSAVKGKQLKGNVKKKISTPKKNKLLKSRLPKRANTPSDLAHENEMGISSQVTATITSSTMESTKMITKEPSGADTTEVDVAAISCKETNNLLPVFDHINTNSENTAHRETLFSFEEKDSENIFLHCQNDVVEEGLKINSSLEKYPNIISPNANIVCTGQEVESVQIMVDTQNVDYTDRSSHLAEIESFPATSRVVNVSVLDCSEVRNADQWLSTSNSLINPDSCLPNAEIHASKLSVCDRPSSGRSLMLLQSAVTQFSSSHLPITKSFCRNLSASSYRNVFHSLTNVEDESDDSMSSCSTLSKHSREKVVEISEEVGGDIPVNVSHISSAMSKCSVEDENVSKQRAGEPVSEQERKPSYSRRKLSDVIRGKQRVNLLTFGTYTDVIDTQMTKPSSISKNGIGTIVGDHSPKSSYLHKIYRKIPPSNVKTICSKKDNYVSSLASTKPTSLLSRSADVKLEPCGESDQSRFAVMKLNATIKRSSKQYFSKFDFVRNADIDNTIRCVSRANDMISDENISNILLAKEDGNPTGRITNAPISDVPTLPHSSKGTFRKYSGMKLDRSLSPQPHISPLSKNHVIGPIKQTERSVLNEERLGNLRKNSVMKLMVSFRKNSAVMANYRGEKDINTGKMSKQPESDELFSAKDESIEEDEKKSKGGSVLMEDDCESLSSPKYDDMCSISCDDIFINEKFARKCVDSISSSPVNETGIKESRDLKNTLNNHALFEKLQKHRDFQRKENSRQQKALDSRSSSGYGTHSPSPDIFVQSCLNGKDNRSYSGKLAKSSKSSPLSSDHSISYHFSDEKPLQCRSKMYCYNQPTNHSNVLSTGESNLKKNERDEKIKILEQKLCVQPHRFYRMKKADVIENEKVKLLFLKSKDLGREFLRSSKRRSVSIPSKVDQNFVNHTL